MPHRRTVGCNVLELTVLKILCAYGEQFALAHPQVVYNMNPISTVTSCIMIGLNLPAHRKEIKLEARKNHFRRIGEQCNYNAIQHTLNPCGDGNEDDNSDGRSSIQFNLTNTILFCASSRYITSWIRRTKRQKIVLLLSGIVFVINFTRTKWMTCQSASTA